jgi:hypothetical protein
VLIRWLLFADLNDFVRLYGFVTSAALGIKELQEFLQGIGVCGVTKKCAFTLHFHQVFGL